MVLTKTKNDKNIDFFSYDKKIRQKISKAFFYTRKSFLAKLKEKKTVANDSGGFLFGGRGLEREKKWEDKRISALLRENNGIFKDSWWTLPPKISKPR